MIGLYSVPFNNGRSRYQIGVFEKTAFDLKDVIFIEVFVKLSFSKE